jgi:ribokinase
MTSTAKSSETRPAVVIVGSYVQDHVWLTDQFPETGETRRALGFSMGPGGKGFNQAVACVRQGGAVAFIGALGDDGLAATARAYAENEGLACHWHTCPDQPTAAACIVVDRSGANQIMVNLAANEALPVDFLHARDGLFDGARLLLVQLENNLDAVRAALARGRKHGLVRMLNPAPVHPQVDARMLADCDLITPNELEFSLLLERLAGVGVDHSELAGFDDARLHALCRKLEVGTIVVTLGAAGCFVSHGAKARQEAGKYYRIAAENVRAIDTVGAGDAFNGALAALLSEDPAPSFRDAVMHANRVAAMSTESIGAAVAMPTRKAVLERFGATQT